MKKPENFTGLLLLSLYLTCLVVRLFVPFCDIGIGNFNCSRVTEHSFS